MQFGNIPPSDDPYKRNFILKHTAAADKHCNYVFFKPVRRQQYGRDVFQFRF